MRAEYDDIPALESDQRFVDRGRCGICGRDNGRNNADRTRDFEDFLVSIFADDPDGFHGADRAIDIFSAEEILERLMLDGSIACLFNRQTGKGLRVRNRGPGHFQKNALDLLFSEVFELEECVVSSLK